MELYHRQGPQTGSGTHRVGVVGDSAVGKTTVATLLADRLRERSTVRIRGDAGAFVSDSHQEGPLDIEWTIDDCPAGTAAFAARVDNLDTAFVVATPDRLGRVGAYKQVAAEHDADCFLVVNRFTEADKDRVKAFEGPELAEYFYEDETISEAMAMGNPPTLEDWTVEAMVIEALQPERTGEKSAFEALETGDRQIVNVEVDDSGRGRLLVTAFEDAGYHAAYFQCNCRCHDGHVLARDPRNQPAAETSEAVHLEANR